jgi:putative transposase
MSSNKPYGQLVKVTSYRYSFLIISHAVWLYHRFTLSFMDIEEVLAARGTIVSCESIRK